jgi:hypothetical protein
MLAGKQVANHSGILGDCSLVVGSYPRLHFLEYGGSEWQWQTQAFYDASTITAIVS